MRVSVTKTETVNLSEAEILNVTIHKLQQMLGQDHSIDVVMGQRCVVWTESYTHGYDKTHVVRTATERDEALFLLLTELHKVKYETKTKGV